MGGKPRMQRFFALGVALAAGTLPVAARPLPHRGVGKAAPSSAKAAKVKAAPAKVAPTVATLPPIKAVSPPPMWAVAYAPDGAHLAVGAYRRVLLYDAATGAKTGDFVVSSDAIRILAYSPDGKTLAAGTGVPGRSGTLVLLDAATGQVVRMIKDHDDTIEAIAWEGNGLLLTAADDESVGINDATTGKSVASLTEHIGRCLSVAVPIKTDADNGGDIFATGGADKAVKIWDAKLRRVVVNFDQSPGAIWCLSPQPRAGAFAAGCDDGKLRIFQVRADGKARANAAPNEPDPRTGYMAREQSDHTGAVYAVATSPDFAHVVTGGADGKVNIWNGDAGYRQRQLTEAKRDIWGVAVSPDSKKVAAASLDGRTRVYDLATGALQFTLDTKGVVAPPPATPSAGAPTPAGGPTPVVPKKTPMPARMTMR
jgi:WD40 repeat protein